MTYAFVIQNTTGACAFRPNLKGRVVAVSLFAFPGTGMIAATFFLGNPSGNLAELSPTQVVVDGGDFGSGAFARLAVGFNDGSGNLSDRIENLDVQINTESIITVVPTTNVTGAESALTIYVNTP